MRKTVRLICGAVIALALAGCTGCKPQQGEEGGGDDMITVNVLDHGAAGDGVRDDTAALKAAVEEMSQNGGGTLYFPAGRYVLTEALKLNTQAGTLSIRGDGESGTRIFVQNKQGFFHIAAEQRGAQITLSDLTITAGASGVERAFSYTMPEGGNRHNRSFTAENVTVDSGGEDTYFKVGLHVPGQWRSLLRNVKVIDAYGRQRGEIGINTDGTYAPVVDNSVVHNYRIGLSMISEQNPAPEGGAIKTSAFTQCLTGAKISSPSVEPQLIVDGCTFDCQNIGLWVAGRKYAQIVNCRFLYSQADENQYTDLYLENGMGNIVSANQFSGKAENRKGVEITGRFSKENMIVNNVFDMNGIAVISNIESNVVKNNVFGGDLASAVSGPYTG